MSRHCLYGFGSGTVTKTVTRIYPVNGSHSRESDVDREIIVPRANCEFANLFPVPEIPPPAIYEFAPNSPFVTVTLSIHGDFPSRDCHVSPLPAHSVTVTLPGIIKKVGLASSLRSSALIVPMGICPYFRWKTGCRSGDGRSSGGENVPCRGIL